MIKKIDIKIIHLFCVVRKESKVEFRPDGVYVLYHLYWVFQSSIGR